MKVISLKIRGPVVASDINRLELRLYEVVVKRNGSVTENFIRAYSNPDDSLMYAQRHVARIIETARACADPLPLVRHTCNNLIIDIAKIKTGKRYVSR